ncbi:hypothetical protein BCR41DRAFT_356812, partial [Lobosporangium transversale]
MHLLLTPSPHSNYTHPVYTIGFGFDTIQYLLVYIQSTKVSLSILSFLCSFLLLSFFLSFFLSFSSSLLPLCFLLPSLPSLLPYPKHLLTPSLYFSCSFLAHFLGVF